MSTQLHANIRGQIIALLPRLRRFARTLTRAAHDADDLVQITVERALVKLDQWKPDSRLESWMFGIMKNAWIDEVRSRGRRNRIFASEDAGDNASQNVIDSAAEAHIHALSVQDAMARLPDEQRLAVGLVLVEGLSYKEAAQILEVPIGTLTSRLARGRSALEAMLADPTAPNQTAE
jgi:RNA polymerase sigma-70 factor (ECF subfamily)